MWTLKASDEFFLLFLEYNAVTYSWTYTAFDFADSIIVLKIKISTKLCKNLLQSCTKPLRPNSNENFNVD